MTISADLCIQDSMEEDECVPHEVANRMSLFYAHATPMLKMLSDTTSTFVTSVCQ